MSEIKEQMCIWLDLNLGNIFTTDSGLRHTHPIHISQCEITDIRGIKNIEDYRKELHKSLDCCINEIKSNMERKR